MAQTSRLQRALDRLDAHRVELERQIIADMERNFFTPTERQTDAEPNQTTPTTRPRSADAQPDETITGPSSSYTMDWNEDS